MPRDLTTSLLELRWLSHGDASSLDLVLDGTCAGTAREERRGDTVVWRNFAHSRPDWSWEPGEQSRHDPGESPDVCFAAAQTDRVLESIDAWASAKVDDRAEVDLGCP